jgi:thiamine-phosphate pyrophosphorylase
MTASGEVGLPPASRVVPTPASLLAKPPTAQTPPECMPANHDALRILDASLNRAGEGLRVVEDYVRFVLDDAHLTELLKQLRHDLAAVGSALPLSARHAARDTARDLGTALSTTSERSRHDAWSVCIASFERVKQSLRSLEEYAKTVEPELGRRFESIRYRLYAIEAAVGRTEDAGERLGAARLYVLVDGRKSQSDFGSLIESLIAGGADVIQLRAKELNDQDLIARSRQLVKSLRSTLSASTNSPDLARSGLAPEQASIRPLAIINDRPDVAVIVDADGVHLGQEDMSVEDARRVVGPNKLIGVSTHSIEQARAAVLDGANYIGVGPTFPSPTKAFADFPGVMLLQRVAGEIRLPAFAIGGVDSQNLGQVIAAGFTRIAVGSAVTGVENPAAAAAELRAALRQAAAG